MAELVSIKMMNGWNDDTAGHGVHIYFLSLVTCTGNAS